MKIRRRLTLYLAVVHLAFAGLAAVILLRPALLTGTRWWVLLVEVLLIVSLIAGGRLLAAVMAPLDTLGRGAFLLQEGDLTTRLRPAGQPEVDTLVAVYNELADRLRDERTRGEERHQLLTQLLGASPSGVIFLDLEGRIAFANPAAERWLGHELLGKRLGELPGAQPVAAALADLGVDAAVSLALPSGGRLRGRRGVFMDRGTPRSFFLIEELTEEVRQAEKSAYEKLIRLMAHEVNNSAAATSSLLTSCLTYAELLPEEPRADFRHALEVVVKRTDQLAGLMRGFAEVVRLPTPQKVPTDVVTLAEDVALLMRQASAERHVEWRWQVHERLPPVPLDRAQMEQVLVNVAKNALEAIGEHGTITVHVGREGGRALLAIEDSGRGIDPEARAQLFTPFFTTKERGQGIGLTLAQQILGAHRFDFALQSAPGGPTRFVIYFG